MQIAGTVGFIIKTNTKIKIKITSIIMQKKFIGTKKTHMARNI